MSEALLRANKCTVWPEHEQVKGASNVFPTTMSLRVNYITVCNDSRRGSNVYDAGLDSQNETSSRLLFVPTGSDEDARLWAPFMVCYHSTLKSVHLNHH